MATREQTSDSQRRHTGKKQSRPPGYGWRPNLAGLEHPRQWMGVLLVVIAVFVIAFLLTWAFG